MARTKGIGLFFALGLLACGGFKRLEPAEDARAADANVDLDAGASEPHSTDGAAADVSNGDAESDARGPGSLGALPSGYCCADDGDCRSRHCTAFGDGGAMCSDDCRSDATCTGILAGFQCVANRCTPLSLATPCVAASTYARGNAPTGHCCQATFDARAGRTCAGGHCTSFRSEGNPFTCTNVCTSGLDCPPSFDCLPVESYRLCVPRSDPYTCVDGS